MLLTFLNVEFLMAQGLVPSSAWRERQEHQLDQLKEPSTEFLGYYFIPDLDEEFVGNVTFQYTSFHEQPVVLRLIGDDEFPVERSNLWLNSGGLPLVPGENVHGDLGVRYKPRKFLEWRGRLKAGSTFGSTTRPWVQVYEAYAKLQYNKFRAYIGRKPIVWGQSFVAPLLMTENATPLDVIQASNEPLRLPGFFRHLGLMKFNFFLSYLGPDRLPGNDLLAGWRIGWKPIKSLELNSGLIYHFGGDGVSDSASDIFLEFFGARGDKGDGVHDVSQATNRVFAVDFRWTLPVDYPRISVYGENHLEDDCFGSWACVERALSYVYGTDVWTEQIGRFSFEHQKTSRILYNYLKWRSSLSRGGRLMGPSLFRDSQGYYSQWAREWNYFETLTQVYWEEYYETGRDYDSPLDQNVPGYRNSEKRLGFLARGSSEDLLPLVGVSGGFSLIRVVNKDLTESRNTWEWGLTTSVFKSF